MRVGQRIYFDHQATTPVAPNVLELMLPYFRDRFGNPHAADHIVGWEASKAVDEAASQVAELIGSDSDEIVFVSGATEANNLALQGILGHPNRKSRNRILVSSIDHKSVLAVARMLRDYHGFSVVEIPVTSDGAVDLAALDELLGDDVLLVSVGIVNGEIGTIQSLDAISALVRAHGALLHTDAAQAPVALDLRSISALVDMLSLSAHKMYGPQGIGALFIERSLQRHIRPMICGGGQQNNLRSGTLPLPLCVGMGAAAGIWLSEDATRRRDSIREIRDAFVERVCGLGWKTVLNGPSGDSRHPGNANIRFDGFDAHAILAALQPDLAASMGSACTSGIVEPSHVLRAIGLSAESANSSIRFSFGSYTTSDDVLVAVSRLASALTASAAAADLADIA
jgi:cysteine desulfurase